jgi:hypothetical protein
MQISTDWAHQHMSETLRRGLSAHRYAPLSSFLATVDRSMGCLMICAAQHTMAVTMKYLMCTCLIHNHNQGEDSAPHQAIAATALQDGQAWTSCGAAAAAAAGVLGYDDNAIAAPTAAVRAADCADRWSASSTCAAERRPLLTNRCRREGWQRHACALAPRLPRCAGAQR